MGHICGLVFAKKMVHAVAEALPGRKFARIIEGGAQPEANQATFPLSADNDGVAKDFAPGLLALLAPVDFRIHRDLVLGG
jgi:hypothetical protein